MQSLKRTAPVLGFVAFSFVGGFFEADRGSARGAFCVQGAGYASFRNCGYPTFEACMAAASGTSGSCSANPAFRGVEEVYPDAPPRRKRRD